MVKGNWIVQVREMRCKNWVNGMEIGFYFNENHDLVSKILFIPREFTQHVPPSINYPRYMLKMWTQAINIFKRAYNRRVSLPVG